MAVTRPSESTGRSGQRSRTLIDFVGKRIWFAGLSAILVVTSILLLTVGPGLNEGIDFTGGTSTSLQFDDTSVQTDNVRASGLAADYAASLLSYSGKVAQLEGEIASETAQLRKEGFHTGIAKYPDIRIHRRET